MLSFIDLLHVISYPFLLWAAWLLHRRNSRDAVSSILSLAVLMTIGAEQPSSIFLANFGIPRVAQCRALRSRQCPASRRHHPVPARQAVVADRRPARLAADPDVPPRHALSGLLRRLHDHRGADAAALPEADANRSTFGSRSAGRCSASPAMPRCAAFRSPATISNGRPAASGISCWSRCSPAFRSRSACCSCSSACSSRCSATGSTTPKSSSADPRISPLITLAVAADLRGHRRRPQADHLQLLRQHQQRGPDHLRRRAVDRDGQPDPGTDSALVGTEIPEEPVPASRRFARGRPRHARNRFARRNARRNPGPDRARRALGAKRGDRRRQGPQDPRRRRSRRSRTGARSTRAIPSDLCESSDRLFPLRVPLVPSSDDEEPIGFLLVGPRPDGSIPSKEEQKALAGVSEAIARAIRTVIKREAREEKVAELIEFERAPDRGARSAARRRLVAGRQAPPAHRLTSAPRSFHLN